MANIGPFKPGYQAAVAITTASVATSAALPSGGETIIVFNATAVPVAVAFDATAPTASATSPIVVGAGQRMAVEVPRDTPLFAAAFPIGTAAASVYFMRGSGSGS